MLWLPPFVSSPYSLFRLRPHHFLPWNSAAHKSVDARSASLASSFSVRPLQRTKFLNSTSEANA